MTTRIDARPKIPRSLYEPSIVCSAAFVLYGVGCFLGFGVLATRVAALDAPVWLRIVLVVPILLAASHGVHLLGWVGHEGVHLNLHRNKYVSALVGAFFSAPASFPALGHGAAHWSHHRYTNEAGDPDARLYPPFGGFWRRFFLARSAGQRVQVANLFRLAFGRPLGSGGKLPFSASAGCRLARLNIGFLAFWFGLYATVAVHRPAQAIIGIFLPIVIAFPIAGLRGYVEHAGTGVGAFRNARSYASPFFTALLFGNNFHLEHHLYPGVPCYRLPELHRFLAAGGYLERLAAPVERTVRGALLHATSRSQYPSVPNLDAAPTGTLAATSVAA